MLSKRRSSSPQRKLNTWYADRLFSFLMVYENMDPSYQCTVMHAKRRLRYAHHRRVYEIGLLLLVHSLCSGGSKVSVRIGMEAPGGVLPFHSLDICYPM